MKKNKNYIKIRILNHINLNKNKTNIILHIHGGGFISNSSRLF